MPRLVPVSASDGTLWAISLRYLNDPLQAGRIAAINGLSDFWLFGLNTPTQLIIPDADASQTDYVPTAPGSDFLGLFAAPQPGTLPGQPGDPGTVAETVAITAVLSVAAGAPFTVSGAYAGGLPTSLDYQIDRGAWLKASGAVIAKGGYSFSVPGLAAGNHTVAVRDSNAIATATAAFAFVTSTASGDPGIPPGVAYDPNNDFGGDLEDIIALVASPAPLGQFVLGANAFAPDPISQAPPTSDFSPDVEGLGLQSTPTPPATPSSDITTDWESLGTSS